VDAAVAMQQLASALGDWVGPESELSIRIGLNTGEPLDSESGGYFGLAVVVAARLCSAAQPGEILATDLVRLLAQHRHEHRFEHGAQLSLKGVPEPVLAYQVGWPRDQRRPELPPQLGAYRDGPFVGRERELGVVRDLWSAVHGGGRQLVLVTGDHGMGVTRLLAEAANELLDEGGTVWFGRADDPSARLAPWSEALGTWVAAASRAQLRIALGAQGSDLVRLVPDLTKLLPGLPAPAAVNPAAEAYLIASAVDALVQRWSAREPVVMVLDQLEDCDPGSILVIRRLLESSSPGRLLMLAGYEPTSVGHPAAVSALRQLASVTELQLGGLADSEVAALMSALSQEPAAADAVRAVAAESAGIPYFVRQMARDVRERTLERRVVTAVSRAEELRHDIRLQREEVVLGLRQLEQLRGGAPGGIDAVVEPDGTPPADVPCPYRGLLPFTAENASDFSGRDELVAEMVGRLMTSHVLAVIGPSGSGKSSALLAGLVPAITGGRGPAGEWSAVTLTPGVDPVGSLARGLAALDPRWSVEEIEGLLTGTGEAGSLSRLVESTTEGSVLLVVDQFEQLWTTCEVQARNIFIRLLLDAIADPRGRVSVTIGLRADFYGRTTEHPELAGYLADSQVMVTPMTASELRSTIEAPARRSGLVLEPGLAQAVLDDIGTAAGGALPLLSTTMQQVWERRRGRSLTLSGYAETGGARGAIAHLAETSLAELSASEVDIARRLLLRLALPSEDGTDLARPALLAELDDGPEAAHVLSRLAERRLLTVGAQTVQVAHEALLREWPRLRQWLSADRDSRRLHLQIASEAARWSAQDEEVGLLLRGARLAAAEEWVESGSAEPNQRERDFIAASLAAQRTELRAARRAATRLRILAVGLAVLLVCTVATAWFASAQRQTAVARANEADARGLAAQAVALSGTRADLALLLAVEGYRREPSLDSETGLLTALNSARYLSGYQRALPSDVVDLQVVDAGRTLLVLTQGGELARYATADGRPVGPPIRTDIRGAASLTVSDRGGVAAYGTAGGVQVVDLRTGSLVGPPVGDSTSQATLSPDGRHLAWKSDQSPVTITRPGSREAAVTVTLGDLVGAFDFSPDGRELTVGGFDGDPLLRRYRLDGTPLGPVVRLPEADPVNGNVDPVEVVRYSPSGDRLLVTHASRASRLVSATDLKPVGRPFEARGNGRVDASFTADGKRVAVSAEDGTIRVANASDGFVTDTLRADSGTTRVRFLDRDRLLVRASAGFQRLDLRQRTAVGDSVATAEGSGPWAVVPGVAPGSVVIASSDGLFEVDAKGEQRSVLKAPRGAGSGVYRLSATADGRMLAALSLDFRQSGDDEARPVGGTVALVDAVSRRVSHTVDVPGEEAEIFGTSMTFSPDGSRLAVVAGSGELRVLDVKTGLTRVHVDSFTDAGTAALLWSRDHDRLYAAGADGVLRTVDATTGATVKELPLAPGSQLTDLSQDVGPHSLLATSGSGTVFVVDTDRQEVTATLSSEGTPLSAVAGTPDGRRVLAVSASGPLYVWDRGTGRQIGPPLAGHGSAATDLVMISDGQTVVTTEQEAWVLRRPTTPTQWAETACRIAGRDLSRQEWDRYLPGRPYRPTCTGR
jgi:WD40 repeat protein